MSQHFIMSHFAGLQHQGDCQSCRGARCDTRCSAGSIECPNPFGDPLHNPPISIHLKAICSAVAGVMPEGPRPLTGTVLTAVENTPGIHNLVVCTLCSCALLLSHLASRMPMCTDGICTRAVWLRQIGKICRDDMAWHVSQVLRHCLEMLGVHGNWRYHVSRVYALGRLSSRAPGRDAALVQEPLLQGTCGARSLLSFPPEAEQSSFIMSFGRAFGK